MRKQTKLVAVLSAAALLAIGASMTSFAETPHWDQEDGEWVYLDRNGDKVTDEWKKSNGQWYYLDEDGYMAKDLLVEYNDNRYYVDENGVKVTNAWVSMDNDDLLDDDDISTVWFYFDGKGKATGYGKDEGAIKSISYGDGQKGYFIFNSDGIMLTGWQEWKNNLYFLGDENEGWAKTGWNYLDTDDDYFDDGDEEGDPYEDEEWFWFGSDGKAAKGKNKQIDGKWYAFDAHGVMMDLWVYGTKSGITNAGGNSTTMATDADAAARYHVEDNGGRDKNWIWAYANTDYDDYDDDEYWFYLDSKGRPTLAKEGDGTGIELTDSNKAYDALVAKSIKSKTYIFDAAGRMRSGLFQLSNVVKGNGATELDGYYYFTDDGSHGSTDGQMVTNKKVTIEVDGEDQTYYFDKTGKAYTNTIISSSLYGADGALVDDYGDGSTYARVTLSEIGATGVHEKGKTATIADDATILINGNGKIKKSGTVTDVDGMKVTVKDYVVTKVEEKN
ncbi:MAG: hypothetical protein Q4C66_00755 [Lachnospiraceae bacterium]|nr:hypothetical protein [Lachnospiraceae bacterium]